MGANSSERHFSHFIFGGSSLGSLGTLLELLWMPLGVSLGASGRLGGSLVTLGDYVGLTLLHLGPPWPPFGYIEAAFFMNFATLGA